MLRRARVAVPLLAGGAALAGALLPGWTAVVVALALVLGVALEVVVARRMQQRQAAVTDHHEGLAAERFREQESERARVEALLDALPTAVLLFGAAGLAYANPAAQSMFGVERRATWTPLRVLGTQALAQAVAEVRETGRGVEVDVVRDDRALLVRATPTDAAEVALIATDVTELRRVEAVRRDFVANASHELKTPAAAMQALADSLALAQDRDPARARGMVGRLQLEATRLARLVRDLLDLTRLEDADEARHRQRVDLSGVAAAQVERLAPAAAKRNVVLRFDGHSGVRVVAIPEDLRLVVANLVTNAIQYNRAGGSVRVRVDRDGSTVRLTVADTGIGIADGDLDRVFERFYRVDKARSRAAGGTGLGLSIVRNAVERHGGRVSLDSVLGQGSTFTVELPVEGAG